jgi:hypothetical protein
VRPPPPFGVVYAGGGPGPPPPFGVIRGAVVAVWLGFLPGSREGGKVFGREFVEIGLRPKKKVVKYFWPPHPPF